MMERCWKGNFGLHIAGVDPLTKPHLNYLTKNKRFNDLTKKKQSRTPALPFFTRSVN